MSKAIPITSLTIQGFRSVQDLQAFPLRNLNVLIGANGAGKSNLVSYFGLVGEMLGRRLQLWTRKQGGADRVVSFGIKETARTTSTVNFGSWGYEFALEPTADGGFVFARESILCPGGDGDPVWTDLGSGHLETILSDDTSRPQTQEVASRLLDSIPRWRVFHFHDTGDTSGMRRLAALHDHASLRGDGSNLAAFLHGLKHAHPDAFTRICKVVRLALPFFSDFVLEPQELPSGESQVRLLWKQQDSDYPLWPSQLSDGSLRFICLATALLQPEPPGTVIMDEPELGLHPHALTLLGALVRSASTRSQIILATPVRRLAQSVRGGRSGRRRPRSRSLRVQAPQRGGLQGMA